MAARHTCPHCETRQQIDPDIPIEDQKCEECGEWLAEKVVDERPRRSRPRHRDEEDEDFDDRDLERERRSVPGLVTAAGIIWLLFGGLALLGAIVQVALFLAVPAAPGAEGAKVGQIGGTVCGFIFGAVFIHVGFQSIRGTAKDVLGNSIGSLIFGVLYTILGIAVILLPTPGMAAIISVIPFVLALTLYAAGTLALVARSDYLAYRKSLRPRRRRGRRER